MWSQRLGAMLARARPCVAPRTFATSAVSRSTVELSYEVQEPPSTDRPVAQHTKGLVVCHGLYGSKQNWRTIAKAMAKDYGDLRNHGASAHTDSMTYAEMAADVKRFFDEQSLSDIALIGHSLGGKVVMSMALDPELRKDALSHLVSVDMSPAQGAISSEFMEYARAMLEIDKANVTSRSEADKILEKVEPELSIRQFLLTNLKRTEGAMHFRIPVETMIKSLDEIGRFPYAPGKDGEAPERQWDGPTLFIKGTKSKYINKHNIPLCKAYFPHMELVEMSTGHWCQAEQPKNFMDIVRDFILKA